MRKDDNDNDNDNNFSNLICKELQDIYRLHSLSRGGVKLTVIIRITNHLDTVALPTIDNKEMMF